MCPPVSLITKAVKFFAECSNASGVLCVPVWRSSPFWLVLVPDGKHFANIVSNYVFFSPKYYTGGAIKSKMFRGIPKWETLAMYIDSEADQPLEPRFSPRFCLNNGCDYCQE